MFELNLAQNKMRPFLYLAPQLVQFMIETLEGCGYEEGHERDSSLSCKHHAGNGYLQILSSSQSELGCNLEGYIPMLLHGPALCNKSV